MHSYSKLSYAIAAVLSGTSVGISHAATATDTSDSEGIQEITVTAQRRTESIQDVPITIQALSGDTLKQLNVQTFDDLIKYTPNVTYSGNNPGGGNIFMRGLSSGGTPGQSQSTTAPFPNVALYLDDQSMQYPARNNDVYLVDMERVEVLEGPQGTLFGGGAQAGAVRYITNKPKLDVTEGDANASYGITARGGDPNSAVNATLNLPLIPDTLAVRGTIFTDHHGGYISNVPGTITLPPGVCPAGTTCPTANNGALVGSNQNTVSYTGARLEGLYKINENWNVLLTQNYQNMEADGYWADYPVGTNGATLGPDQINAFAPAYNKDKYESTSWTLNGTLPSLPYIGDLKMVYTGSYLVRHIQQQADYSNYLTTGAGSIYDCSGIGAPAAYFKTAKATTCYAPVGSWNDNVTNDHQSHEIRLTTDESNRIRGTFGGFWEDFVIHDEMNFNYLTIPQCDATNLAISAAGGPDCVSAVGPLPGNYANDPSLRTGTNTAFGEDVKRGYRQSAAFASLDFDIIPKVLTITGGTRYFHYDEFERGTEFNAGTSGTVNVPNGVCTAGGGCGFGINLNNSEHGFRSRGNLTWHVTPDILAYYTYSQGFRPGGFNRTESSDLAVPPIQASEAEYIKGNKASKQYLKPVGYSSDNLTNDEIGLKTEWFEHRLQANASIYRMKWSDVQILLFDPTHLGNTQFAVNGPTYSITGVELQLVGRVTEGLTLSGSSSWNSTAQTNAPCLTATIVPTVAGAAAKGSCITQINGAYPGDPAGAYTNPFGVLGTSPAYSPPLQFNLRARYDMTFMDYKPFVSVGAQHIATMRNEPASYVSGSLPAPEGCLVNGQPNTTLCKYEMPGYTTYDASVGVAKDTWTVSLIGNNLSDSNASTNTNSGQFIKSEVPLRPRVLTLSFGYKF